jgi:hypothetical protein
MLLSEIVGLHTHTVEDPHFLGWSVSGIQETNITDEHGNKLLQFTIYNPDVIHTDEQGNPGSLSHSICAYIHG